MGLSGGQTTVKCDNAALPGCNITELYTQVVLCSGWTFPCGKDSTNDECSAESKLDAPGGGRRRQAAPALVGANPIQSNCSPSWRRRELLLPHHHSTRSALLVYFDHYQSSRATYDAHRRRDIVTATRPELGVRTRSKSSTWGLLLSSFHSLTTVIVHSLIIYKYSFLSRAKRTRLSEIYPSNFPPSYTPTPPLRTL